MFNNTCVHSIYFALSQIFSKDKLEPLGDPNKLSSQLLIRGLMEIFPGSTLMRATREENGWQLREVDHLVPQGNRPYLWGSIALATTYAALVPMATGF